MPSDAWLKMMREGEEKLGMRLCKPARMIKHMLDRVTDLSDPRSFTRVGQFTQSRAGCRGVGGFENQWNVVWQRVGNEKLDENLSIGRTDVLIRPVNLYP